MFNENITIKGKSIVELNVDHFNDEITIVAKASLADLENNKHDGILPKKYIINHNATILFWDDETKTVVKKTKDDAYNKKLGFLWAYFQKMSGLSKTKANEYLENLLDDSTKKSKLDWSVSDIYSFDHTISLAFKNITKIAKSMETKK